MLCALLETPGVGETISDWEHMRELQEGKIFLA